MIKWYPWLNKIYRQILTFYQKGFGHHAILLKNNSEIEINSLFYAISRWLFCKHTINFKSCNYCHNCKLMIANNHPDYFFPKNKNYQEWLNIDNIRKLINNINYSSHQGGVKIIILPKIELTTEITANALLKTLEEPPKNTYFLLNYQRITKTILTIKSRCLTFKIKYPNEKFNYLWLKKKQLTKNLNLKEIYSIIRLAENSPLIASYLLKTENLTKRVFFLQN